MPSVKTPLVGHSDIYGLTSRGEAEIRGSKTNLTALALELLVRADGHTAVHELQSSMSDVPSQRVAETLARLLHDELIQHSKARDDGLRMDDIKGIARSAIRAHPAGQSTQREATAGINSLKQDGFYVRIARRPDARPMLPADRPPTLLVIEDEPHLARFLSHFMRFEGFDVRLASDRTTIVEGLRTAPQPDLVLLDVMLPDVNGFDVLTRIREHEVLRTVPVLMLTSIATRESVIKGLVCGADGYVTKPFQVQVLVKAIQTIFGLAHERTSDPWEQR
jgi:two-component system, OmpR family, response regulator